MVVSSGPVPRDAVWEVKWDGFRACVAVDGIGDLRVATRSGRLVQDSLPELAGLAQCGHAMTVDGELIVGNGMPSSFYRLASRLASSRPEAVRTAARATPVTLVIFDLLWFDGMSLLAQPYYARRERLEGLQLQGRNWVTPPVHEDGHALLEACAQLKAEGVVAKDRQGNYIPGKRSPGWVKRKCPEWAAVHAPRRRPGTTPTVGGAPRSHGR
jgi:bifunctional non-homologous end joining protein LigD